MINDLKYSHYASDGVLEGRGAGTLGACGVAARAHVAARDCVCGEAFGARGGVPAAGCAGATRQVHNSPELTQARLLVYDLAARLDAGADGRQEAAMAKYVATEMVGRVADRAIQVFGGNGYMTEMGIERWARFVRAMRLYEGTSEILKTNIARTLGLEEASR